MPCHSIVAVFVETMIKYISRDVVMDGKGGNNPTRKKDVKIPRLMDLFAAPPTQFQTATKDEKMPHLMDVMVAPPTQFQTINYSSDIW